MTDPSTFRDYLLRGGMRPKTVDLYARYIQRADGSESPDPAALVAWLRGYVTPTSPSGTVASARAAVVSYLTFTGYVLPDPPLVPAMVYAQKRFRDALTEEQYAAWCSAVETADLPPHVRMIITVLPLTGLRIDEACKLRIERYDRRLDGSATLTVEGKGGKVGRVPVVPALADLLDEWVVKLGGPKAGWLFPSPVRPGEPFTAGAVRFHVDKIAAAAGIARKITPHVLRHTAATRLLRAGVNLKVVQEIMRHSSVSQTEKYLHPTEADLAAAVAKL